MVKPRVFMNFTIGEVPAGRVIFELFTDTAPKTAENFRALCTGERGVSPISEVPLYYKGSTIHRAIPDFMIQGGDFTKGNGTGGESIYGAPFADEDLEHPVDEKGLLVMANRGPNTNSSQFFVTVRACPHLDGKHVCFGRVVSGYDVIEKISNVETDGKDRPLEKVVIASCGELEFRKPPPKPVTERAGSLSESDDLSPPPKGKRRHRDDDSEEEPSEDDEEERKRHKRDRKARKKQKREKRESKRAKRTPSAEPTPQPAVPHQETEEEYDARLEREEQERIMEIKRRELEALKRDKKDTGIVIDGIRYKGRGAMRYRDPESYSRHD